MLIRSWPTLPRIHCCTPSRLPCRVIEEWFLSLGCAIGYWQGDVGKLVDDIAALKPAMFFGVPRVFDRIYSRIDSQVRAGMLLGSLLTKLERGRED
eukprot:1160414-Pelagomonas_calceolata.AAC.4